MLSEKKLLVQKKQARISGRGRRDVLSMHSRRGYGKVQTRSREKELKKEVKLGSSL